MSTSYIKYKPCGFNCGQEIFWDKENNEYREKSTKKRHVCPNYKRKSVATNTVNTSTGQVGGTNNTPNFKKDWTNKPPNLQYTSTVEKPRLANSFEYLTGSVREIRLMYEELSRLIREAGGKVHGSQRGQDQERMLDILVYYEVPELSKLGVQDAFSKWCSENLS